MPKIAKVEDIKPKMSAVDDVQPKMSLVGDIKPQMSDVFGETEIYLETRTIPKGQPIGLLLTLTYPEQLDFNITRL